MARGWENYRDALDSLKPYFERNVNRENLEKIHQDLIKSFLRAKKITLEDLNFSTIRDEVDVGK